MIFMPLPAANLRYTFEDYLKWDEGERFELIDGEAMALASPSNRHQEILVALIARFQIFLEGKKCRVYPAPFDVRLFERDTDRPQDVDTIVQPDITIVCDRRKLDGHGCKGTPDMVVEILSPSTYRHDRLRKFNLYQRAGVREYWIIEPETESVQVFLLDGNGYLIPHEVYGRQDVAKVNVLDGCFIELSKVFAE